MKITANETVTQALSQANTFSLENSRYQREYYFSWLLFSNNKWFQKFSNKSGQVVLKFFLHDTHYNWNSAICGKTENRLDVGFSQQESIHGPPVEILYVCNERLRIPRKYFYRKNDVHQLRFLPWDLE